MKYLLGTDIGTSGTKTIMMDLNGQLISKDLEEYGVLTPHPLWAEQWPDVWLDATKTSIRKCVEKAGVPVSDIAGIDSAMKLGANHPMGPLELGDYIGLDICLAIMDVLYKETGDSKYRACPLLRKMVRGGNLGVKSGKGFYIYNADRTKTPSDTI